MPFGALAPARSESDATSLPLVLDAAALAMQSRLYIWPPAMPSRLYIMPSVMPSCLYIMTFIAVPVSHRRRVVLAVALDLQVLLQRQPGFDNAF